MPGLVFIGISSFIIPVFEELYYRGICLPTLQNAVRTILIKRENERINKQKEKNMQKNKKSDSNENEQKNTKANTSTSQEETTKKGKKSAQSSEKAKQNKKLQKSSEKVASSALNTLPAIDAVVAAQEKERHGVSRNEQAENRAFLKAIWNSFILFFSRPSQFLLVNAWLLHSILCSLSFALLNPFMFISRIVAFVSINQQVMSEGIISMAFQIQLIMAFIQFMNLVQMIRNTDA